MGLDVFLYKYDDYANTERKEKQFDKEANVVYKNKSLSDAQKQKQTREIAKKLGLNSYGSGGEKIELPSKVHPKEGLFQIGYFRSSYSSGGIDSVLRETVGMDLYDIFDPKDEYCFRPDWRASLSRANDVRGDFKKVSPVF